MPERENLIYKQTRKRGETSESKLGGDSVSLPACRRVQEILLKKNYQNIESLSFPLSLLLNHKSQPTSVCVLSFMS